MPETETDAPESACLYDLAESFVEVWIDFSHNGFLFLGGCGCLAHVVILSEWQVVECPRPLK